MLGLAQGRHQESVLPWGEGGALRAVFRTRFSVQPMLHLRRSVTRLHMAVLAVLDGVFLCGQRMESTISSCNSSILMEFTIHNTSKEVQVTIWSVHKESVHLPAPMLFLHHLL